MKSMLFILSLGVGLFLVGCGNESSSVSTLPAPAADEQGGEVDIPTVKKIVSSPSLHKPTHIIRFGNHYVATLLEENKLAIFDDLDLNNLHFFDPETINQNFGFPHFLAISTDGHLLISNGWENSIVEIEDLDGSGWKEFDGLPGSEFDAPHGICVDGEGWIYVGDSLNSRIVRFKNMQGASWQVFKDVDRKVAYSRQLVCKNGTVWISNSYENREGLNPGEGSNILRIDDFSSGKVQVVYADKYTNITGILPLDNILLMSRWGSYSDVVAINIESGEDFVVKNSHNDLGVPYGFFEDIDNNQIINAYFGSFDTNYGGFTILAR